MVPKAACALVAAAVLMSWPAAGVGPVLKVRARLLRDLGLSQDGIELPTKESRTLIDMSLAVRTIDLDFATGTFRTDGWMVLRWHDSRFTWDPDHYDGISSVPLPFSNVWAPEVILHNSVEERFMYRQVGVVKNDGRIVYTISVHALSACQPNFADFPFGMQRCQLKFGSWVNEQYKVEYRLRQNETVELGDFSSPSGWRMAAAKAHLESRQYPLFDEPSHSVVFDFAFRRDTYFDASAGKVKYRLSEDVAQTASSSKRGDQRDF